MKNALVKLNVDLYAPGALLSPQAYKWISGWDNFHTRRIVFPVHAMEVLVAKNDIEEYVARMDFCHIRISSMDAEYQGLLDSEFDFLLTNTRLDFFLGNALASISQKALLVSPPYKMFRTYAAWLELWEFDEEKAQLVQWRPVDYNHIIEHIKQKTT